MRTKAHKIAEARLFIRLGAFSLFGLLFYYAHLFFGLLQNGVMYKALAIAFLFSTIPLPVIVLNNTQLFPELTRNGRMVLALASALLLFHHFLMTFLFVLILRAEGAF